MKLINTCIAFVCIIAFDVFADLPVQKYRYHAREISDAVRLDTFAIITIRLDPGFAFKKKGNNFIRWKDFLKLKPQPFSVSGYSGVKAESYSGQYPVTARQNNYIQIVIDSKKNRRTWIKAKKARLSFLRYFLLEPVPVYQPSTTGGTDALDLFYFNENVKIYQEPYIQSKSKTLNKKDNNHVLFLATIDLGNMIGISKYEFPVKQIGYVLKRDEKGRLNYWHKNVYD